MPLLGGYFFVRRFILARYAVAHDESTKVYYRAALAGCLLAAAAALLHNALEPEWADYAAVARDARIHVLGPLLEKPDAAASAASAGEQQRREAGAKLRALIAMVCVWAFVLGLTAPVCNAVARLLLWLAHLPILLLQKGLLWLGWAPRGPRISPIERLNRRAITDDLERMLYDGARRVDPGDARQSQGLRRNRPRRGPGRSRLDGAGRMSLQRLGP